MSGASFDLSSIGRQFMSLERPKKPKMLVVDDEPDNLDLLYRTFRRDFNVLRAESGLMALDILAAEGEVAVIISDQRMPEMKGTEFLSKTVPQFPDTMRIILTGFTDVEDLVEAINSGQVYKYITKPWDPTELKAVVQRAAETYDLLKQRTDELRRAQAQLELMNAIVQLAGQYDNPEACLQPIATAYREALAADGCVLHLVDGRSLTASGSCGLGEAVAASLATDPLLHQAIDSRTMQGAVHSATERNTALEPYAAAGVQAHLLTPILFQDRVLGVLSLQWQQPRVLWEDELTLIHLAAQQVGLVLTCTRFHPVVV
ncbi:MAG: response regulator [Synechococcales cyanobacterium C42_A2020_086]|jgi:CheY-like chemotaxis protein|nr:response regulator [Synechococcales cyanobacterium C42_A2020_086]